MKLSIFSFHRLHVTNNIFLPMFIDRFVLLLGVVVVVVDVVVVVVVVVVLPQYPTPAPPPPPNKKSCVFCQYPNQVGLNTSDRFAQVASMSWDVHIIEVYGTLSSQACSVTCPDLVKKSGPAAWFWTTKKEGWR